MAAGCALGTQLLLYFRWLSNYVNEDQALLWAAAREWGHFRPHQPNFWGQDYNTTFEAIPTALFHGVGISYAHGLTLAVLLLNLFAWFALGRAAWRLGRRMLAVLAFGAIAAMSVDHAMLTVAYNTAAPRALLALCAAVLLVASHRRWVVVAALSLGLLTVCWDASGLLLFVPMALFALARLRPRFAQWRFLLGASFAIGAPSVMWVLYTNAWYERHPEDALHPGPAFEPGWSRLIDNLSKPSEFFGAFGPAPWATWLVPVGVVLLLLVLAVRRRDVLTLISLLSIVGVTFLILSVPRASESLDTPYLPSVRTLLPLPLALVFCAAILHPPTRSTETAAAPRAVRFGHARIAVALAMPVVGVLALVVAWQEQAGELKDKATGYGVYPARAVDEIEGLCARVQQVALDNGIDTVVFDQKTPTYACAALGTPMTTLYPVYERRSWELRTFLDHPMEPFVFVTELDDQISLPEIEQWCKVVVTGEGFQRLAVCRPDELVWRIDLLNFLNQPVRTTF